MDYLSMIRDTMKLVGMQGVGPTTIVGIDGVNSVLATMVRDAYIDIQSMRDEFDFLNSKLTFLTSALKDEYTPAEIFLPAISNLNKYDLKSLRATDAGKTSILQYVDREVLEQRYLDSTSTDKPKYFSIDYSDNSLILKPTPDKAYTISFRYWETPEILTEDAQVPKLPLAFHSLIVYKAVEKMSIYMNVQGSFGEYNHEVQMMTNQLMRKSLRKKTLRAGALV